MYKTETHLHTAESSPCSKLSAEEMLELYYKAGYKTVIVTDHFIQKYLDRYNSTCWQNAVERFFLGYRNAKAAGDKLGVNVIPGAEIHLTNVPGDYLLYGVTQEILCKYPDICKMTHAEFYRTMRGEGVLVVQAHPRRDGGTYSDFDCVDGLEVFNSNPRHDDRNELAQAQADEHKLYKTAGSDAHRLEDYALSGMESENEIKTIEDFIALVKSEKGQLIKQHHGFTEEEKHTEIPG